MERPRRPEKPRGSRSGRRSRWERPAESARVVSRGGAVCGWVAMFSGVFPNAVGGKLVRVPVVALILVSTAAGLVAWRGARSALNTGWGGAPGAAAAAELRSHSRRTRFVRSRLDAEV